MKYWLLFALRMMLRIGLLMAVAAWVMSFDVSVFGIASGKGIIQLGLCEEMTAVYLVVDLDGWDEGRGWWFRSPPDVAFPGASIWSGHSEPWIRIEMKHWFHCLVFLLATIATSVNWRKKAEGETGAGV